MLIKTLIFGRDKRVDQTWGYFGKQYRGAVLFVKPAQ